MKTIFRVGIAILALVLLATVVLWAAWLRQQESNSATGISVVVSFYPLAEFAHAAGGNLAHVTTIVLPRPST